MRSLRSFALRLYRLALMFLLVTFAHAARAQGPAPETAPPLFPGGGLVSYNSIFTTRGLIPESAGNISPTARPTFSHEGDFNFTWGFFRNFDLTVLVPIVTNHFDRPGASTVGGTGLGDAMVLVKYRFYRRDSQRGTTQASVTFGPKLPTGRTDLNGREREAPAGGFAAGFGFDRFLPCRELGPTPASSTCRRLVADEDFHSLLRTEGTQSTRLGSDIESRFWLSYRPYESKNAAREWFIGPALTWLHSQDDQHRRSQPERERRRRAAGRTSPRTSACVRECTCGPGWTGTLRIPRGAVFMPVRRHISFGITQQFRTSSFVEVRVKEKPMNTKKLALLVAARRDVCARRASADQAHRNARRRHDLKLLSLRGEATPRTPVWRSKSRSQFDRWKSRVTPKEDGQIDPAQLLKATYDSGVTVAEMDVIARGKIVKDSSGSFALQVEPNRAFALSPNDLSKELEPLAGTPTMVTVRGQLYKKPAGKTETRPIGSAEAADPGSSEEGINAD